MSKTHEMTLTASGRSGTEEWLCPTCGRRVRLRWPPHFERLVLEPGDEDVVHIGGNGGRRAYNTPGQTAAGPGLVVLTEAERKWLYGLGIDWDGLSA